MALEYRVVAEEVEVLRRGASATQARVSHESVMVLHRGSAHARVASTHVMVLRSIAVVGGTRRRIAMIHSF